MRNQNGRDLTGPERAALDFLLAVDDARFAALREQAQGVVVVAQWDCCPTVEFGVTRGDAHAAVGLPSQPVEAHAPGASPDAPPFELVLHVDSGWLRTLELVHYDRAAPSEFPEPAGFSEPWVKLAAPLLDHD